MSTPGQDERFATRSLSLFPLNDANCLDRRRFLSWASLSTISFMTASNSYGHAGATDDDTIDAGNPSEKKILSVRANASTDTKIAPRSPWNTTAAQKPFVLYSTLDLVTMHTLATKLLGFRKELEDVLQLSFVVEEIKIVVLRDKREYDAYLQDHFPHLPKRRALFVQHRGPGLVLTYMHDDWIVDARHECAHAMLHSCRTKLPSWIDEGLAEYFETPAPDRLAHREHVQGVLAQIRYGQVPAIDELEQWHIDIALESKQYREAWSVVSFLLHYSPESRATFQQYLRDLQSGAAAGYLGRRLSSKLRQDWRKEFLRFYQLRGA